jgi:nitroreductase
METWDAIRSRRNVRDYRDQSIPSADLDAILESGWRSPSSKNRQWWDFVVVTDRKQLESLSAVWQGAGWIATSAATVALIAPVPEQEASIGSIQYDLGLVTMAMMLAATDRGIGSGQAYVHDQALAREVLGFPPDRSCAWLLALGYPADRPLRPIENPRRRPLGEVIHKNRW